MKEFDVGIIGGGIVGASTAYWLGQLGVASGSVALIERDPTLKHAATALSAASIRQQFSNPINVKISQFGVDFISKTSSPSGGSSFGLKENGYLFLCADPVAERNMVAAVEMQQDLGAGTILLEPSMVKTKFPFLELHDIRRASFGTKDEGWFDQMSMHRYLKSTAKASGCHMITGNVERIRRTEDNMFGVALGGGGELIVSNLCLSAGIYVRSLMQMLGLDIPVEPRKRTVFVVDFPDAVYPDAPLIVDHTGYYARPEGSHWICAMVPKIDPEVSTDDFEPDWELFESEIWPKMAQRSKDFERARVVNAWVGHYDYNTFDQNALVGAWPGIPGLYIANGFSGHGLQQAPAVGLYLAELIRYGAAQTLDLEALSPKRLLDGRKVIETGIV